MDGWMDERTDERTDVNTYRQDWTNNYIISRCAATQFNVKQNEAVCQTCTRVKIRPRVVMFVFRGGVLWRLCAVCFCVSDMNAVNSRLSSLCAAARPMHIDIMWIWYEYACVVLFFCVCMFAPIHLLIWCGSCELPDTICMSARLVSLIMSCLLHERMQAIPQRRRREQRRLDP